VARSLHGYCVESTILPGSILKLETIDGQADVPRACGRDDPLMEQRERAREAEHARLRKGIFAPSCSS